MGFWTPALSRPLDRALTGELVFYEPTVISAHGEAHVLHTSYSPGRGTDGAVSGFAISAVDTTERQAGEAALREWTELLNSLLHMVPHQVFWKDRDLVYQGCNAKPRGWNGARRPDSLAPLPDAKREHQWPGSGSATTSRRSKNWRRSGRCCWKRPSGCWPKGLERAERDPLTGLLNHRAFHKRLQEEAAPSFRRRDIRGLALA